MAAVLSTGLILLTLSPSLFPLYENSVGLGTKLGNFSAIFLMKVLMNLAATSFLDF